MANKNKKVASSTDLAEFNRRRAQAMGGSFVMNLPPCFNDQQIEELRALVDADNSVGEVNSKAGGPSSTQRMDSNIRRSKIHWLDHIQYKWVYDTAWKLAKKVNEQYQFEIKPISEGIQISVYDESESGFYTWHSDANIHNMTRKISMSIPLSSPADYVGGELQFMMGGEHPRTALQPKGGVIVFPSYLMHRVTPVTKGRRYSMVIWVGGPNWR